MAGKWVGEKGALGLACAFYYLTIEAMSISKQIFVQSAAGRQVLHLPLFARASFVSRAPFIAMQ
jgi:hypothetical protein